MNIEKKIVDFLVSRFEIEFDDEIDYDTDLFEYGFIDSLESLVIITFIEKTFNLSITPNDLIDNPINSVNEMVSFISDSI